MARLRSTLIEWVRARIDEASPVSQALVASSPTIGQELDEAALQVIRSAPKQFLYPVATDYSRTNSLIRYQGANPYSCIIPLKDTFARFLRVRLYDWEIARDEVVSVDSAAYQAQGNAYQRGTVDRPVAALIPFRWDYVRHWEGTAETGYAPTGQFDDSGNQTFVQALEAFPVTDVDKLTTADLWTIQNVQSARNCKVAHNYYYGEKHALVAECLIVNRMAAEAIPEELVDPMVWLTAGRILSNLRQFDAAKVAMANAQAVMTGIRIGFAGEEMPVGKGK